MRWANRKRTPHHNPGIAVLHRLRNQPSAETQLNRIKPQQKVKITLDLYTHSYEGIVQSISYSSGSTFSLLPAENATGNWIKVAQRFTVRIALKNDPDYPLRVGASAVVKIYTY